VTRLSNIAILLVLGLTSGAVLPSQAQSSDPSLGDLARSLRKTQAPPRKVIDNDNLSEVMEAGVSKKWDIAGIHFSVDRRAIELVNASSPDVTCALAYSGQQVEGPKPESVPVEELIRIDGPATITGDVLQVAVQNKTNWELREITVGLTVIRQQDTSNGAARLVPASLTSPTPPERRSDMTVLYHLRGKADAMGAGLFQDQLKVPFAPDQDWRWSIVQAKGIRPAFPDAMPPMETNTVTQSVSSSEGATNSNSTPTSTSVPPAAPSVGTGGKTLN